MQAQKGPSRPTGSNPEPAYCEASMLTTYPSFFFFFRKNDTQADNLNCGLKYFHLKKHQNDEVKK